MGTVHPSRRGGMSLSRTSKPTVLDRDQVDAYYSLLSPSSLALLQCEFDLTLLPFSRQLEICLFMVNIVSFSIVSTRSGLFK